MSLINSTTSLSNFGNHAIQTYPYSYLPMQNSPLDPITSQLIKTQDAALQVSHLWEEGAFCRLLKRQETWPSSSWIGDKLDWIIGCGRYHPNFNKRNGTQKRLIENRQESLKEERCPDAFVFRDNVNTAFTFRLYPNMSCSLIEAVEYGVNIVQHIWRNIQSPDDVICRVAQCVTGALESYDSGFFPCTNATETERSTMLNTTYSDLIYDSIFDKFDWEIYIFKHYHKLNRWKVDQLVNVINRVTDNCEEKIYHPKPPSNVNAYYSLLIIPVAIAGVGGVIFGVYRYNRKKQYIPLENIEVISDN